MVAPESRSTVGDKLPPIFGPILARSTMPGELSSVARTYSSGVLADASVFRSLAITT